MKTKQVSIFLLLCGLTLLVSCKQDEEPDLIPNYYWGEASFDLNDIRLEPKIIGVSVQLECSETFGLIMDNYSLDGLRNASLTFSFIPIKLGNGILVNERLLNNENNTPNHSACSDSIGASFIPLYDDGDVLADRYDLDATAGTNSFEITAYNESTREVSGTFDVTFVLTYDHPVTPDTPDTVRFFNGKFHTKIIESLP